MRKEEIRKEIYRAMFTIFKPFIEIAEGIEEVKAKMNENYQKMELREEFRDDSTDWKVLDLEKYEIEIDWLPGYDGDFDGVRYRLKPAKKTHEELAEEYVDGLNYEEIVGPVKQREYNIKRNAAFYAFIAGRKSMEEEDE